MKKRLFAYFVCGIMLICLFISGCTPKDHIENAVVCTSFAQYDFVKHIVGDKAEVVMLIHPGSEAHDYEPSAGDIKTVSSSSLFVYNGGESEAWVERLISSSDGVNRLKLLDCCETPLYLNGEDGVEIDEHIWTSPKNALLMCEKIYIALTSLYPESKDYFEQNYNALVASLKALDNSFTELAMRLDGQAVIIGDRNPFGYLARDYGIEILAAFHGCGHESEPSAAELKALIDKAREQNADVVFYVDFSNGKIARTIASELGNTKILHLSSCHNVSQKDFNEKSYCDLMTENINNLLEVCNAAD